MKYPRGFIDPHRQHFYSNGGKSHRKNAEEVIEKEAGSQSGKKILLPVMKLQTF